MNLQQSTNSSLSRPRSIFLVYFLVYFLAILGWAAAFLTHPLCASFSKQLGESEVPAYLQDETAEPATVVPAQPASATGEQVDEFGLPIAQPAV